MGINFKSFYFSLIIILLFNTSIFSYQNKQSLSYNSKIIKINRFASPLFLFKCARWVTEAAISDVAKLAIKHTCNVSSTSTIYLVDYGCEAAYAGITKGPDRIPHELIKYACAQKVCHWVNQCIDCFNLEYPSCIKETTYAKTTLYFVRPLVIRSLVRLMIDLFVDVYLEEPDQEMETDF